ncbi:MAG: S8 family serine peptidase [Cyclobacteriaceae bacterium]
MINIKILSKSAANELLPALTKNGFVKNTVYGNLVTGNIPIAKLDQLDNMKDIIQVQYTGTDAGTVHIGSVDAQGDSAMLTNVLREDFLSDGSGVKIGIISNSFNNNNGYNAAILSGDLPGPGNPNGFTTPVDIRNDFPSPGGTTDEGRAMAELIHDVAPGAELAFSNFQAFDEVDFAAAINSLVAANCDIIVDDIGIFAEPYYLDGIAAQAIDNAVAQGVTYFSSAGNDGRTGFYERVGYSEVDIGIGVPVFEFTDPGTANSDVALDFQVNNGSTINIFLQWDEPWASACNGCGGAQTELDFALFSNINGFLGTIAANAVGGDAINRVLVPPGFFNYLQAGETDVISILIFRAEELAFPGRVKIRDESTNVVRDQNIPFDQQPTLVGHANAESCISVGAAAFLNTPAYSTLPTAISGFDGANFISTRTSVGGAAILFDQAGNRINAVVRENPDIVGPDASETTFFGQTFAGFNNPLFFGTSASAPTVAAATALLLQSSNNTYTPQQLRDVLVNTALDMDDPYINGVQIDPADPLFETGYDFTTGFGYVQPLVAFNQVINDVGSVAISLEEVCSENPSTERRWEFTNPNGFALTVNLSSSNGIRLPGENTFGPSSRTYNVPPGQSFIATALFQFSTFTSLVVTYQPVGSSGFGLIRRSVRGNVNGCTNARTVATLEEPEEELSAIRQLQVYPNPSADGNFTINIGSSLSTDELVMQIYDVSGKKFGQTITRTITKGNNQVKLDLSNYATGVYLLHMKSTEVNNSQRLLIE